MFEGILNKYNSPKRNINPMTSVETIENAVKLKLPSDYKIFIQNYSAFEGQIGHEFVQLWDIDELLEANIGYGIFDNLPNTLAIGGNGSSEFIAIEFIENQKFRIILSPFIDLDKQYHIDIGVSFTDFLIQLDNGRKWFE